MRKMYLKKNLEKVISILLLACMSLSMLGCGTKEKKVEAATLNKDIYTDYNKLSEKRNQFTVDPKFIASVKQFANHSTAEILQGTTENVSYSPISLYFALAVLTEGSKNETAKELFDTLGLSDIDYDYLSKNVDELYRFLYCDMDQKKLKIANAVWMDKNFDFLPSYGDAASKLYHSSVFCTDFRDPKTSKKMEDWIAKQLNNVMKPKVEIKDRQVLTIMNTIYYAGSWVEEFYKGVTSEEQFHLNNDETVNCDFMFREKNEDYYVDQDGYKIYEMPMTGGDSMIFCLPDEGVDIDELMKSCDSIDELFNMSTKKHAHVKLALPKFDYECKLDLNKALNQLGIQKAMDLEKADFTRISEEKLFLSKATQQVHITVDEEGVVGAAYTELEIECGCALEPEEYETVELNYNRPFLYQIVTTHKIPVFTGIVRNPSKK